MTRITIKDSGELRPLAGLRFNITAGIHEQEGSVEHGNSGKTVAEIATIHEFGYDQIPSRMWLRRWSRQADRGVAAAIHAALIPMARRMFRTGPGGLKTVAKGMRDSMRAAITGGGIRPANAPMTLAKKAPETRPLFETGAMVESAEVGVTSAQQGWNYNTRNGVGP